MPLPSDEAVPLRNYNDVGRVVSLRIGGPPWPEQNHSAFYVDGHYSARLPIGDYELIIAKGPEYRIVHEHFKVETGISTPVRPTLQRWDDMAARGWYSGDDHIHYARDSAYDDRNLLLFTRAEDLHVANLLQMGNSGNTHFRQYNWKEISTPDATSYVLVPGQEDPRTIRHGHSIELHLTSEVRNPERYLLYNEIFERARAQGGVIGYAHFRDAYQNVEYMGTRRGMALDAPFGLIDFAEILQWGDANTGTWFNFLNLGAEFPVIGPSDFLGLDPPDFLKLDPPSFLALDPPRVSL